MSSPIYVHIIVHSLQLSNMTTKDIVNLTTDVLSVEEATSLVSDASIGATSIFIGLFWWYHNVVLLMAHRNNQG